MTSSVLVQQNKYLNTLPLLLKTMQVLKKKNVILPHTITVYRGRSPLMMHQYSVALFQCQHDANSIVRNMRWHAHNRWMTSYKTKKIFCDEKVFPQLEYSSYLRVRDGAPVSTNMLRDLDVFMEICPSTSDFCSFEHDKNSGCTTLVVDESRLDFYLPAGLYKASLAIEAPLTLWTRDVGPSTRLFDENANCLISLKLTLHEFVSPLQTPEQKSSALKPRWPAGSLGYYLSDFRNTFNI